MINIAKLLKDAPKGMKLYSPLFGEVEFIGVFNDGKTIKTKAYPEFPKSFFEDGRYFSFPDAECLLFPSKDCRTWEGWKLPSKPAFKVNEWIILDRTYTIPIQIVEINQKEGLYTCKSIEGLCGNYSITQTDKDYHLWTIADAKDGDIIHTPNNNLFIYKCKGNRGAQIWDYCGLYHGKFEPESSSPNGVYNSCDGYVPATKEQRDSLFAKMQKIGYEWDADKKELLKTIKPKFKVGNDIKTGNTIDTIAEVDHATRSYSCESGRTIWFENQDMWYLAPKPHYDIINFHEGMPVLVRNGDCLEWEYVTFSHYRKVGTPFCAGGQYWFQCIPFSEDTKHLLGTIDPCDERYINW